MDKSKPTQGGLLELHTLKRPDPQPTPFVLNAIEGKDVDALHAKAEARRAQDPEFWNLASIAGEEQARRHFGRGPRGGE
jgi:hypothetical protein